MQPAASVQAPVQTRAIPRAYWTIEPGQGEAALFVTATLTTGDGAEMPATPREIIEKVAGIEQAGTDRTVARLLGSGGMVRTAVPKGKADAVDKMLRCLLATERLRWHSGAALKAVPATGEPKRTVRAFRDPRTNKLLPTGLPEGGALIKGLGYWCVDPGAGQIFPVDLQIVTAPKSAGTAPVTQAAGHHHPQGAAEAGAEAGCRRSSAARPKDGSGRHHRAQPGRHRAA